MATYPPSAPPSTYTSPMYVAPLPQFIPAPEVNRIRDWLAWSIINIFIGAGLIGFIPLIFSIICRIFNIIITILGILGWIGFIIWLVIYIRLINDIKYTTY